MDGTRFLLWIALPIILLGMVLFILFKPSRPVGGPVSEGWAPPGAVPGTSPARPAAPPPPAP